MSNTDDTIPLNLNNDERSQWTRFHDHTTRDLLRTISTLRTDLARVTAERDAAVANLRAALAEPDVSTSIETVRRAHTVTMAERDRATSERDAAVAEVKACVDKQAENEARYREGVEAQALLDEARAAQKKAEAQAAADRARYDLACLRADRATTAAAALKEEFNMYLVDHEKWGNGLLQTMTASRARAEHVLATDVGAAYAREHEEMRALISDYASVRINWTEFLDRADAFKIPVDKDAAPRPLKQDMQKQIEEMRALLGRVARHFEFLSSAEARDFFTDIERVLKRNGT